MLSIFVSLSINVINKANQVWLWTKLNICVWHGSYYSSSTTWAGAIAEGSKVASTPYTKMALAPHIYRKKCSSLGDWYIFSWNSTETVFELTLGPETSYKLQIGSTSR
jgi:hypothetical protein